MSEEPLVSVIVPLFNYRKFIGECIKSVLRQTYANFELIVVDDCSTDESLLVAKEAAGDDERVIIVPLSENGGYSKAKNEGICISSGELITCLDADDMFTAKSLAKRVAAFRENAEVDFVHANALNIKGLMTMEESDAMKKRKRQNPVIHAQTVMLKRFVHEQFGLYDENLRSRSDKEMWVRLFGPGCEGKHKIKKHYLNADVAYYRKHQRSMMAKRKRNKKLQRTVKAAYNVAVEERQKNGITTDNTRFLERRNTTTEVSSG